MLWKVKWTKTKTPKEHGIKSNSRGRYRESVFMKWLMDQYQPEYTETTAEIDRVEKSTWLHTLIWNPSNVKCYYVAKWRYRFITLILKTKNIHEEWRTGKIITTAKEIAHYYT